MALYVKGTAAHFLASQIITFEQQFYKMFACLFYFTAKIIVLSQNYQSTCKHDTNGAFLWELSICKCDQNWYSLTMSASVPAQGGRGQPCQVYRFLTYNGSFHSGKLLPQSNIGSRTRYMTEVGPGADEQQSHRQQNEQIAWLLFYKLSFLFFQPLSTVY